MKNLFALLIFLSFSIHSNGQIQLNNDEFDSAATLSNWSNITDVEGWNAEHLRMFNINTTSTDKLYMRPWTTSWFGNWRGPLLFKNITGDFSFTTQVSVTDSIGTGLPSSNYSLAGIMIRESTGLTNGSTGWVPGQEDFIFLSLGYASETHSSLPVIPTPPPHLEIKSTNNSSSSLQVSGISTASDVQIRINRIGPYIICMYKEPGNTWVIRNRYNRTDFPPELQVGFVTYTDWPKLSTYTPAFANDNLLNSSLNPDPSSNPNLPFTPDLIAEFEFARFDSIVVPSALAGLDLSNPTIVSDSILLDFLGFPSQPYIPNNIQYVTEDTSVDIYTDHENEFINITGMLSSYTITLRDEFDNIIETLISTSPVLTVDTSELPNGVVILRLEHLNNSNLNVSRIIQE